MFYYEYVKIKAKKLLTADFTEYRQIIDEYTKKGYRYVGVVPTVYFSRGELREMDLVFETEEREKA